MKIAYLFGHKKFTKVTGIIASVLVAMVVLPSVSSAENPVIRQGTTSTYAVLAASTITNTGATTITGTAGGDIGLSPGTSFTGSAGVTTNGVLHITDTAASIAQTDLVTAYNDLGVPTPTTLSSADLAGQTVLPGTYATASGTFANSGTLTFDAQGDSSAVFIFQAASTVITSPSSTMVLTNEAQAYNIYWQVGSSATLGVSSTFRGHIYALTSITANTGATVYGQLLARNGAVTLDTNTIVNDSCIAAAATTTSTPSSATTAPSSVTTAPSSVTTAPAINGDTLPSTGIDSLSCIAAAATTTSTPSSATTAPSSVTTAPTSVTTAPSVVTTAPSNGADTLPNSGIDSLIWILGVVFIIGLITGIIRIRR